MLARALLLPMAVAVGYQSTYSSSLCANKFHNAYGNQVELDASRWEEVPLLSDAVTSFSGVPDGCECVNDISTPEDCTVFRCRQGCNLVRGQCDTYCCSDPDCSAEEVAQFTQSNMCYPEEANFQIRKCQSIGSLEEVNAKYRMHVDIETTPLDSLLCVSIDNNPIKGDFYDTPLDLIGTTEIIDNPEFQQLDSFAQDSTTRRSIQLASAYVAGSFMPAVRSSVSGGVESVEWADGGFLKLPIPGPNGVCLDTNFVSFGEQVLDNSCRRIVPADTATFCTSGQLSYEQLVGMIKVGSNPRVVTTDASAFAEFATRTVQYRDVAAGLDYPYYDYHPDDATLNSTARLLQTAGMDVETTWVGNTCENAVTGVRYVIYHDNVGTLEQTEVDVFLSNITLSPNDVVDQSFMVEFINTSPVNDTGIKRVVSGNPGYIQGMPVQAGDVVTQDADTIDEKQAIQYNRYGLMVNGPAGLKGECFVNTTEPWWESMDDDDLTFSAVGVDFGINMAVSCSVEMTYEEFTSQQGDWCTDISFMSWFDISNTHIGIYGNADPLKAQEWVQIDQDLSTLVQAGFSPAPGDLTCQNIVNEQRIQILWTKTGELQNPQPMILSAKREFSQTDWTWKLPTTPGLTQKFVFSQVVTFLEYTLTPNDVYKPATPPLLPAIPSDVFYPFDIKSNHGARQAPLRGGRILFALLFCGCMSLWARF